MSTVAHPLHIAGVGRYLPERVVTNQDVEKLCGLRPGTFERTDAGVIERRWAGPDDTISSMAAAAALEALEEAGIGLDDLDLIINGSGTQEQEIPDGGPLIQRALGRGDSGIPCFSVHSTCLGFVHALDIASVYFAAGRYRNILIANADMPSRALNFAQPESAVLFGDVGAAVVVQRPDDMSRGVEFSLFETFGDGAALTQIRGGGSRLHPNDPRTQPEDNLFDMDPLATFTFATRRFMRFARRLEDEAGEDVFANVDWVVPHQPSMKALKVLHRLGTEPERIVVTLDRLGNAGSASMPGALYEAVQDGRIGAGQRILFIGTGAGLSFGAVVVKT